MNLFRLRTGRPAGRSTPQGGGQQGLPDGLMLFARRIGMDAFQGCPGSHLSPGRLPGMAFSGGGIGSTRPTSPLPSRLDPLPHHTVGITGTWEQELRATTLSRAACRKPYSAHRRATHSFSWGPRRLLQQQVLLFLLPTGPRARLVHITCRGRGRPWVCNTKKAPVPSSHWCHSPRIA